MQSNNVRDKTSLKVLFLAAEASPFVKIGGLGEVAGSLPKAIKELAPVQEATAVDIRLVIPFHGAIQRQAHPFRHLASFTVPSPQGDIPSQALETELDGLPVYFISGPPIPQDAPVYTADPAIDGYKFTYFSLAVLELARTLDWAPDILHANDWHTAPAIYALKVRQDPFFANTASLLGLHNLPYLGEGAGPALDAFGLPPSEDGRLPWWAQHLPLPLGLLHSDHIVVVSPHYAREILTPEYGVGLEDFLKSRLQSITGILNGLDTSLWDPATDSALAANFTEDALQARDANKAALARELDLNPDPKIPLLAMVSRLDPQKGVDLVPVALRLLAKEPWQLVILGTGTPELEEAVRELEAEYPNRVRTAIRFDAMLSRRIYSGADALLIPSRYEPCGLTQMIAMRYGCVPVARAVGGLRDTVHDHHAKVRTGFLFARATSKDLASLLRRVFTVYENKEIWQALQRNGMSQDLSWKRSATQYQHLYQQLKRRIIQARK